MRSNKLISKFSTLLLTTFLVDSSIASDLKEQVIDQNSFQYMYPAPTTNIPNTSLVREICDNAITNCNAYKKLLTKSEFYSPNIMPSAIKENIDFYLNILEKSKLLVETPDKLHDFLQSYKHTLRLPHWFFQFRGFYMAKHNIENRRQMIMPCLVRLSAIDDSIKAIDNMLKLVTPVHLGWPQFEQCDESNVTTSTLPTNPIVEEGMATIATEGELLKINLQTEEAVITFDTFWIGPAAKVIITMPTKGSKLSLYQRSGKPTFIYGGLEKNQGYLKLFYPHGCTRKGAFMLSEQSEGGGYYQRKVDRRYIQTLTPHFFIGDSLNDSDRSLEDLFRSVDLDKTKEEGLLSLPGAKLQDYIRQLGRKLLLEPTTPTQEELLNEQYLSKKELLESRINESTSPEEGIDAARDLYMLTVKSAEEGSKIAKVSILITEVGLLNKFTSVKEKLSQEKKIVILKDIKNLLAHNLKPIPSNVPAAYYLFTLELGAALFESAQADMSGDSTENRLREAMDCFEYALENHKNTDSNTNQTQRSLENNLAVSKGTLGWFLRSKIRPQTKVEEFTEQDIDILLESYSLIKAAKEISFEYFDHLRVITSELENLRNMALSSKPLQQKVKEKLLSLTIFDESTIQGTSIIPFETHFTKSLSIEDKQEKSISAATSHSNHSQIIDINTDQSADELYQKGLQYRDGKVEGCPKDSDAAIDSALTIFRMLSEQGHIKAMHNRANIHYKKGEYVEAYTWFKKAAEKGLQPSQNNLNKMVNDKKIYSFIKDLHKKN